MSNTTTIDSEESKKILHNANVRYTNAKKVFTAVGLAGATLGIGGYAAILGWDNIKKFLTENELQKANEAENAETSKAEIDQKVTAKVEELKQASPAEQNAKVKEIVEEHQNNSKNASEDLPEALPVEEVKAVHWNIEEEQTIEEAVASARQLLGKGAVIEIDGIKYSTYTAEENAILKAANPDLDLETKGIALFSENDLEIENAEQPITIVIPNPEPIANVVAQNNQLNVSYSVILQDGETVVYQDINNDGIFETPVGILIGYDEDNTPVIEPFYKPNEYGLVVNNSTQVDPTIVYPVDNNNPQDTNQEPVNPFANADTTEEINGNVIVSIEHQNPDINSSDTPQSDYPTDSPSIPDVYNASTDEMDFTDNEVPFPQAYTDEELPPVEIDEPIVSDEPFVEQPEVLDDKQRVSDSDIEVTNIDSATEDVTIETLDSDSYASGDTNEDQNQNPDDAESNFGTN